MALDIGSAAIASKNKLEEMYPWVWLYEIEIPDRKSHTV